MNPLILSLPWGRGTESVDLTGLPVHLLRSRAPKTAPPVSGLVGQALAEPLAGPPLAELARGWRRATVLVPDATRKASLPEVLPVVLNTILGAGVPESGVVVLVACGTHPAVGDAELSGLLGALPEGVRAVQHDARDSEALVPAGRLNTGLNVRLHRLVTECDGLVAVSTVQHHYFAGFGGGPKLVFPGVAGYEEIQANHARVLDLGPPIRRHPGCEPGRLAGNPVAEEIAAAAALRPMNLLLTLVNGDDGSPRWAASGRPQEVFAAACGAVREWFEVAAGPFARMVASGGGHPGDDTLIQAHKALDAACRFLQPGGELLFIAELGGGAGSPAMAPFLADPRPESILSRLAENYVQYGHTTLRLVEKTGRFNVALVSRLDRATARRLNFVPVDDPNVIFNRWRQGSDHSPVGVLAGTPVFPAQPARSL